MTLQLTYLTAWRVDFNVGLSSFEPNIRDLRTLIDLALKSRAKLTFISSISVLSGKSRLVDICMATHILNWQREVLLAVRRVLEPVLDRRVGLPGDRRLLR